MLSDKQSPYTVLARRFRPQSFGEVVGQEHVAQALQNAMKSGRVAHAYLFTGARGVGKTSTARIFAKALNCKDVVESVPCGVCEICTAIGAGTDVDVLEIDGASNRGIDDVRQLRASVGVRPMRSEYKIYIIDEVHMLTKEAFNALLKTLEEPPANVKFVFCTTEPNKVPDTILSRCQRFDFGTIDQESIAGQLKKIATAEGKSVEDDAIELVARRANGSMRDSQSLFDQLLAFGGERITTEDVHRLLGTASDDRLIQLIDFCLAGSPGEALQLLDTAMQEGVQSTGFTEQLLGYLRDLLIAAAGADRVALSTVTESSRERVLAQANRWGLRTISAAMQIVAETKSKLQKTVHGRALLELAVVRLATLESLDQIASLLLSGGAASASGSGTATSRPAPSGPLYDSRNARQTVKNSESDHDDIKKKSDSVAGVDRSVFSESISRTEENRPAEHQGIPRNSDSGNLMADSPVVAQVHQAVSVSVQGSTGELVAETPHIVTSQFVITPENCSDFWQAIQVQLPVSHANQTKHANRVAISGPNLMEIWFPKSYTFAMQYCMRVDSLQRLKGIAAKIAGEEIEFRFTFDEKVEVVIPAPQRAERTFEVERLRPSILDHDTFVQNAVAVFGGQIAEVRPLRKEMLVSREESDTEASADEN